MAEVIETPAATPDTGGGITITRIGDKVIEQTPEPPTPAAAVVPEIPATPPETPQATEPPDPVTPEVPVVEDEEVDFFPYASEQTGGFIKGPEDVFSLFNERNELKKQLAEKPKFEFPNEQAKLLYELSSKFPGQELSSAQSILHVLSLDLGKMSDKEKQFEAFALENKSLTREESRRYFEAKYEKNFGNGILDEDVSAQFDHRTQTIKAEESLAKFKDEFSKLPPSKPAGEQMPSISPEEINAIKQDVSRTLNQFKGVKYEFFKNDPNSVVNVALENVDLQRLESYMVNPGELLNDLQQECTDSSGNFSNERLAIAMFEFKNRDRIREQAFKAGVTYGELKKIKEIKNTSTPQTPATPPAPVNTPKNLAEAMAQAGIGKKKVAA